MRGSLNGLLDELEDSGRLSDEDALLEAFSGWATDSGRPLYAHQEQALLDLFTGSHVIAATPTGSGKSLIALGAHFLSLARGGRSYYTAPLKALVSEKFFDLVDAFGATNVGMVTGDASLNASAPIICCTAEILANQSLREGAQMDVDMVIMDEFHFYGDPQRGWAWQIPLLQLPQAQVLALSATLGDTSFLETDLEKRTGRPVATISDAVRPVPLEFDYCVDELPVVVERLLAEERAPIYIVHFAQREAVATASGLERLNLIDKEQRTRIAQILKEEKFGRGFGQTLRGLLNQGIGVHHAGMLPRYRRVVERLAQQGLLAVICGTDTLGVGINVPIRTVLFSSLVKFDGHRTRHLSAREFHQIAGRAGRAGFDTVGYVRALASEKEIEGARRQARLSAAQEASNQKKLKKLAKKSPAKGSDGKTTWTRATFDRLRDAQPEVLHSHFSLNHAFFLNVLSGNADAEAELLRLARDNHEESGESNQHLRELGDVYRSLKQAGIVTRNRDEAGHYQLRAVKDLPDDFALNQPLAPFALAAFDLLNPESPDFALDILSVVEAVIEDPSPLLYAQQRRARDAAMQAMRAEGLDYAERTEALSEITWPMPLQELLEPTFRVFAQTNPWVGSLEPSPKSVVREMVENALTFSQLISLYDVANAEGVVLRYLTDVYRALGQILPARYLGPEIEAIIDWLGKLVRTVDSSLLDEWSQMSTRQTDTPEGTAEEEAFGAVDGSVSFQRNTFALRRAIRNAVFSRIELMSRDDVSRLGSLDADAGWGPERWDHALGLYWAEHDWIGIDHEARAAAYFNLNQTPTEADLGRLGEVPLTAQDDLDWWIVEQTILDPAGDGDWRLTLLVDVQASIAQEAPVLTMVSFGPQ